MSQMLMKPAPTHRAARSPAIEAGTGQRGGDVRPAFGHVSSLFADGRFAEVMRYMDALNRAGDGAGAAEIARYAAAREICDFTVLAEFAALVAQPDTPAAAALLAGEPLADRVLWDDGGDPGRRPSLDAARATATPPAAFRRRFSPAGARIRIGYLSAAICDGAAMRHMAPVLALHDREAFEVTLFCHTPGQHDDWRKRHLPAALRKAIVPLRGLDDAAAAAAIAARGIDILVDLDGHGAGARPGIVNRCDAPVKAGYLGYPGTIGGLDIDYAVTDRFVSPVAAGDAGAEKRVRLPESFQANDTANRLLPLPSIRAAWGLPPGAFVFAAFNGVSRITPGAVALWARILDRVPHAVLWILCDEDVARRNLVAAFAAEAVAAARLVFTGSAGDGAHLPRLPLADLALDTFPCNGQSAVTDMLWAGVPVLTARGSSPAGRVSESLLNAIGLPELVAADDAAFCKMAAALARTPGKIGELKQRLAENRCCAPLFNGPRFTAHLERAYAMMAARARDGLAPDHIDVPVLPACEGAFASRPRSY